MWEENEFGLTFMALIRTARLAFVSLRVQAASRRKLVDEYYSYIFDHSVPGLPERAAESLTPLAYMWRYGASEVQKNLGPLHEQEVPPLS